MSTVSTTGMGKDFVLSDMLIKHLKRFCTHCTNSIGYKNSFLSLKNGMIEFYPQVEQFFFDLSAVTPNSDENINIKSHDAVNEFLKLSQDIIDFALESYFGGIYIRQITAQDRQILSSQLFLTGFIAASRAMKKEEIVPYLTRLSRAYEKEFARAGF